ncbi:restriction endonuclease subunit S [Streptococcus thermophilus]|nr:restriction endonuclease subunit S [Streptococcus thermophilus]
MMSKKVPELRFKGFTDDWEQRKLGEVGNTFTGLSGKTKEDFGHGEGKFITYVNVFNNPVADLDGLESVEIDNKQFQVKAGDVLFTTSSETPEEVGMSSMWLGNADNIYLNSFCFGYRPTIEFDNYYLAFMLRSASIRKKFQLLAQGISRYNISKNKVMEMSIPVPSIEEQQKIGAFFKQLDDTIALYQRKLDLLKEQKKGFLQKMFPKNGAKVPELRFAGFADDWEERKLSDIVSRLSKSSNNSELPRVEFEDIVSGEGRLNKDVSHKFDDRKGILFSSQNILYGKLRPYLKNWLLADFKGIALGDFWVFKSINSDPKFVYSLIQSNHYQKVANDTSGTKMPRSDWKKVSSTEFQIPSSLEEQKKIGSFFKKLDDTIALHQRKLDLLKEQKKGFLQKMFV